MSAAAVLLSSLGLCFALTRAELVARMKAPVQTRADGFIRVYAACDEDLRREYQSPVARFAADTVAALYRGLGERPVRFREPGLVIRIGGGRTNDTRVVTRVVTNESQVVTRLYLPSAGFTDLTRLRQEVARAFFRSVKSREVTAADAETAYRRADPAYRIACERSELRRWRSGGGGDDETNLARMLKVFEPGRADRSDVLLFASRLFLYPRFFDEPFLGRFQALSFGEALTFAKKDPRIRFLALEKANEMVLFGGGRGEALLKAAEAYEAFLRDLARFEKSEEDLRAQLDAADALLALAYEESRPTP